MTSIAIIRAYLLIRPCSCYCTVHLQGTRSFFSFLRLLLCSLWRATLKMAESRIIPFLLVWHLTHFILGIIWRMALWRIFLVDTMIFFSFHPCIKVTALKVRETKREIFVKLQVANFKTSKITYYNFFKSE